MEGDNICELYELISKEIDIPHEVASNYMSALFKFHANFIEKGEEKYGDEEMAYFLGSCSLLCKNAKQIDTLDLQQCIVEAEKEYVDFQEDNNFDNDNAHYERIKSCYENVIDELSAVFYKYNNSKPKYSSVIYMLPLLIGFGSIVLFCFLYKFCFDNYLN